MRTLFANSYIYKFTSDFKKLVVISPILYYVIRKTV